MRLGEVRRPLVRGAGRPRRERGVGGVDRRRARRRRRRRPPGRSPRRSPGSCESKVAPDAASRHSPLMYSMGPTLPPGRPSVPGQLRWNDGLVASAGISVERGGHLGDRRARPRRRSAPADRGRSRRPRRRCRRAPGAGRRHSSRRTCGAATRGCRASTLRGAGSRCPTSRGRGRCRGTRPRRTGWGSWRRCTPGAGSSPTA